MLGWLRRLLNVTADHGSVAAGRDITGPVTVGLDEEGVGQELHKAQQPLRDELERLAAQVARDKGVQIAPLRAILVKLGETGVKDEDIPKRLEEKALELDDLRAKVDALQQASPGLAAIVQEAKALIDKGDFDGASRTLAARREASRIRRIDASREDAEILALDARVDDLQFTYRSAAAKYAEAASLVAPFDAQQQWQFLIYQADALFKQGDEFGENAALVEAIDVCHRCLSLAQRSDRPLDWATTQADLCRALKALGKRESGTARLEEAAAAAYREALLELTRDREPVLWAATQNNLANVLLSLGERESGTARLNEAVATFREALQELTRERRPLAWATTQMNLGNALEMIGARESGTARLEEAVTAYNQALKENTRARVPLE